MKATKAKKIIDDSLHNSCLSVGYMAAFQRPRFGLAVTSSLTLVYIYTLSTTQTIIPTANPGNCAIHFYFENKGLQVKGYETKITCSPHQTKRTSVFYSRRIIFCKGANG